MSSRTAFIRMGVCGLALLLCGCGGGGSQGPQQAATPVLSSLSISPSTVSIAVGKTQKLSAIGTYSDGSTRDMTSSVEWQTSDNKVATIVGSGYVQANAEGTATLSVVNGSTKGTAGLTVTPAALDSLSVDPPTATVAHPSLQQFTATGIYTDGTQRDVTNLVTWSVSPTSVAHVSTSGMASADSAGTANVVATSGTITASATLSVTDTDVRWVSIVPYEPVLGIGVSQQLRTWATFQDYGVQQVTAASWSSSDSSVASIDTAGVVTTLKAGRTTITAVVDGVSGTVGLTVLPIHLTSIAVTSRYDKIASGTSTGLTATGTFDDGSMQRLDLPAWSSSDSGIATIDANGLLQGKAPGSVAVTAQSGGITGTSQLTVTSAQLRELLITPASPVMPMIDTTQLYADGVFSDGTEQDLTHAVTWISKNPYMVKMRCTGLAGSAASSGSTVITAQSGAITGTATITVNNLKVDQVVISPANASFPKGTKQQFTLTGTLSNGGTKPISSPIWIPGSTRVATADDDGLVTGREPDTTPITGEGCCKNNKTNLTVTADTIVSIAVSNASGVPIGAAVQFTATGTFSDGSTFDVTKAVHWSSSNSSVAVVDQLGRATALGGGSAAIIATFGPVSGSTTRVSGNGSLGVTSATLSGLTIAPSTPTLALGTVQQLTATGTFSDGSAYAVPSVTWTSSNPDVVVVSESGFVRSAGKGTANVTASTGTLQTSVTVIVN